MAISVPTYTTARDLPAGPNQMPSVRQTAAPTADMLGGNLRLNPDRLGAGLASATKDVTAIHAKMQEREDADLIMRAEVAHDNALRERQADWQSRKGVNAWNLTREASQWFDNESGKFADGLNERQRRVFDERAGRRREGVLNSVSAFEQRERVASQVESQEAAIANQINRAIDGIGNPDEQTAARTEIDRLVTMQSRILGWDGEQTTQQRGKAVSMMHTRVIESMSTTNARGAQEYYAARKHEIDAGTRSKIEAGLQATAAVETAQAFADKLADEGASEADGLRQIRASLSGDEEKLAVAEWKTRNAEIERAREREQRAAQDAAWDITARGGGIGELRAAGVWDRLDGPARASFVTRMEARAERAENRRYRDEQRTEAAERREEAAERRRENSPEARRERLVRSQVARDRILNVLTEQGDEAFVAVNLYAEADLSDADIVALRTEQRKIENGESTGLELKQVNNEVAQAIKSLDIKDTDKRAKASAQFRQQYEQTIEEFRATSGRAPTKAERRTMQDELLQRGLIVNTFFDDEGRRFEARARGKEFTAAPKQNATVPVKPDKAGPVRITTDEEFLALPSGAEFIDPNGKKRKKP